MLFSFLFFFCGGGIDKLFHRHSFSPGGEAIAEVGASPPGRLAQKIFVAPPSIALAGSLEALKTLEKVGGTWMEGPYRVGTWCQNTGNFARNTSFPLWVCTRKIS